MAIRQIRKMGDDILSKTCRPVTEMTDRINVLIDDMLETMYDAQGVGLAAPQVGILKRIVVIDVSTEEEQMEPLIMINPVITESSGEDLGQEGCLSVPGKVADVTRPTYVKAIYKDRNMKDCEVEGHDLLARCICHELDHLDGHLYVEKAEGPIRDLEAEE